MLSGVGLSGGVGRNEFRREATRNTNKYNGGRVGRWRAIATQRAFVLLSLLRDVLILAIGDAIARYHAMRYRRQLFGGDAAPAHRPSDPREF